MRPAKSRGALSFPDPLISAAGDDGTGCPPGDFVDDAKAGTGRRARVCVMIRARRPRSRDYSRSTAIWFSIRAGRFGRQMATTAE
jgi:hypothetical protein